MRDRLIGYGLAQTTVQATAKGNRARSRLRDTYIKQAVEDVGTNNCKKVKGLLLEIRLIKLES